jgi:hypothetical protein
MAKHRILFQAVAATVIEVDLPDDITDPAKILEAAENQVDFPDLCNHCGDDIDLADQWKAVAKDGQPLA